MPESVSDGYGRTGGALVNAYPHELDGGRRQRIGIARALAMEPKFIVCDEPVSAPGRFHPGSDPEPAAGIKRTDGAYFYFHTHDLSVVNHFADEIAVMYLGQLIEKAPTEELFDIRSIRTQGPFFQQSRFQKWE